MLDPTVAATPGPARRARPLLRTMVGDVFRRTRLAQRRTLADVARAAKISMPYLSELERGRKEASSEVLAAICDALRIELADLLACVETELAADRLRRARLIRLDAARRGWTGADGQGAAGNGPAAPPGPASPQLPAGPGAPAGEADVASSDGAGQSVTEHEPVAVGQQLPADLPPSVAADEQPVSVIRLTSTAPDELLPGGSGQHGPGSGLRPGDAVCRLAA
jgi:transcriptional regulator with XRE-family HTH domain